MTIEVTDRGKSLDQIIHDANRGLTSSSINYRLNDLGENKGGQLIKWVSTDSIQPDEIVFEVDAGEEKEYAGGFFRGS